MKYTLASEEKKEINDVRHSVIYTIHGYEYTIRINPHSEFWRFSLRSGINPYGNGHSDTHRYHSTEIRHLEICAGTRNPEWRNPNILELQGYNIDEERKTYFKSDQYQKGQEVTLKFTAEKIWGFVQVELVSGNLNTQKRINLSYCRVFEIYAWADSIPFELEFEINSELVPISLKLGRMKALSNQDLKTEIRNLSVFFGGNNSGKSSVLMAACNTLIEQGEILVDYLGLNRIHSASSYDYQLEGLIDTDRFQRQLQMRTSRTSESIQHAPFDWVYELGLQTEESRQKIIEWINTYFEPWILEEIKIGKFTSGLKLKANNTEPIYQGSGAKSILPIIIQLFNPLVSILTIDEPELGLEPKTQKILMQAINDASQGKNGFPLKRILIATHSHLFLDRQNITNNYNVRKIDGQVSIHAVEDMVELQEFVYALLGASPSDLFFPSQHNFCGR